MPYGEFLGYLNCIDSIESQEQLLAIYANDYGNWKKSERSKYLKSLRKAIRKHDDKEDETISSKELFGKFKGLMRG